MECRVIWYGFFKSYILVNMERSLDKEGTAVLFKSTQACDKDACLVRKCFPQCHWAMSKWRRWAEGCSFGFDLGDGLPPLLDLRFADDILIFARSPHEIMTLLDKRGQTGSVLG